MEVLCCLSLLIIFFGGSRIVVDILIRTTEDDTETEYEFVYVEETYIDEFGFFRHGGRYVPIPVERVKKKRGE